MDNVFELVSLNHFGIIATCKWLLDDLREEYFGSYAPRSLTHLLVQEAEAIIRKDTSRGHRRDNRGKWIIVIISRGGSRNKSWGGYRLLSNVHQGAQPGRESVDQTCFGGLRSLAFITAK